MCDAARRILSYDPSTFYSPIVDLPVADTNITIRFTLSQFKQYNGLKDYIALKISSILSRPDALLLCNKPKCGSLHDMTDGAAHQEWIKFYEEKYGIEPIIMITRLYSDGTAKRNLNNDEIHVFRVCLAIGGRQFTFQNFKSINFDVAFSSRFSIWHRNTQMTKRV